MKLNFRIKHHFFSAFREFFVHHHGSLAFRAKVFALVIAADSKPSVNNYIVVKNVGMQIYKNDEDRANLLMLSTKELVQKVKDNNGLDIDTLVASIQKELRIIPRFAKKIDIDSLRPIVELAHDQDVISYQENILEFLEILKDETLQTRKAQILQDEKRLGSIK
jgi:hypothetical protein